MSLPVPKEKPLVQQKEFVEQALAEAFARDLITVEELEKRLNLVQTSQSNGDLSRFTNDLPQNLLVPVSKQENRNLDLPASRGKKQTTILSSNILKGAQLKKNKLFNRTILGEQTLDYSKTILEPGKYYVEISAVLGEVKIIVPPEYAVTTDIIGVLSEVKNKSQTNPSANVPEIIVTGRSILASVSVKVRNGGILNKILKFFDD